MQDYGKRKQIPSGKKINAKKKAIGVAIVVLSVLPFIVVWYFAGLIISPKFKSLEEDRKKLGISSVKDFGFPEPESVTIRSGEIELKGWIFKAAETSSCGVIAHHGYTGTRWGALIYASLFYPRCHVLVYDSRAHGESSGSHVTLGAYEKTDLINAANWFLNSFKLPASQLILFGESMGAATVLLAAEMINPGLVVADSPYSDLRRIVKERAEKQYGSLANLLLTPAIGVAEFRANFKFSDVSPSDAVKKFRRPLIVIHSGSDDYTHPMHSRDIFLSASHTLKRLFFTDWGAKHARSLHGNREDYLTVFKEACLSPDFLLACKAE